MANVPPNPGAYPAGTNTWVIPIGVLGLPPTAPAKLRFTATERTAAPTALPGVNELIY